jgi:hypothetical protein
MKRRESRENTFRNGWGKKWTARSGDLVLDLVGEKGEEEDLPAPCSSRETKRGRVGSG